MQKYRHLYKIFFRSLLGLPFFVYIDQLPSPLMPMEGGLERQVTLPVLTCFSLLTYMARAPLSPSFPLMFVATNPKYRIRLNTEVDLSYVLSGIRSLIQNLVGKRQWQVLQ